MLLCMYLHNSAQVLWDLQPVFCHCRCCDVFCHTGPVLFDIFTHMHYTSLNKWVLCPFLEENFNCIFLWHLMCIVLAYNICFAVCLMNSDEQIEGRSID